MKNNNKLEAVEFVKLNSIWLNIYSINTIINILYYYSVSN